MGHAAYSRQDRVKKALMREISDALANDIRNPLLDHQIISVTDIDLAKDFSYAKVYLSFLTSSGEKQDAILDVIREAAPKLQSLIGRRMQLRNTTKLQFFSDDSLERGSRVANLLSQIAAERGDNPASASGDTDKAE